MLVTGKVKHGAAQIAGFLQHIGIAARNQSRRDFASAMSKLIVGIWKAILAMWTPILGIRKAILGIWRLSLGIWKRFLGIWKAYLGHLKGYHAHLKGHAASLNLFVHNVNNPRLVRLFLDAYLGHLEDHMEHSEAYRGHIEGLSWAFGGLTDVAAIDECCWLLLSY